MRTSIAIAIVAAAATAVSADCNPSYNVPTSTPCFTACNVKAGSAVVPGWTMDSSSENFLPSLKLMCTKNVPAFTEFMTVAGTCMMGCAGDDPELFNAEFAGACAWYASHKDDACATETTTTSAAATTKDTTTVKTTTVQTTVADTTTAAEVTTTSVTTADVTTEAPVTTTVTPVVPVVSSSAPVVTNIPAVSSGASVLASSGASVRPSASVSPSASGDPVPSIPAEGAANKLQISGLAMALVAGVSYLAL
ncbi:hypothetical protein INT48_008860 [Thamnidium elegans]|uniref:Uncharacterized protein n=1 Tax=Thamnidium elegans TaxID=101142 RepID=A0A8H7W011_9FUNG|nr:hypothetical protein INT48_008860 [Thamnidium elegans]